MCERLDGRSFARSLSLLDSLMLKQRPRQSVTDYARFMRQTFDDYNETCELIDGSAAIHPHNMGMLVPRGISNYGQFGQAKQCVINAFDTNYLISADDVMANILHMVQNMADDLLDSTMTAPGGPALSIFVVVAAGRNSHEWRGHNTRGGRGGRGLPKKCNACGSLNHIFVVMHSATAYDDAPLSGL
jgi:hypothetical protein